MRKIIFILGFLAVGTFNLFGQQDPQFTHYVFNQNFYNPASVGTGNEMKIQSIVRAQYAGYNSNFDNGGAPNTQIITFGAPVPVLRGGAGIYVSNDNIGPGYTTNEIQVSYSFQKALGKNILCLGINGGGTSLSINGDKLRPVDPSDPSLPNTKVSQFRPDFGAGLYLYNSSYNFGISAKHINRPTYSFATQSGLNTLKTTLYLNGMYRFAVTYALDISPMLIVKSDLQSFSASIGALATYNNRFYGGLSYRTEDALGFLLGGFFAQRKLQLGYALDLTTSNAKAKAPLSHELILSYKLIKTNKTGKKSIIRTPRYSF